MSNRPGGACGSRAEIGVQQQAQHDDEQQVEADENLPLDADGVARPDHGRHEDEEQRREERREEPGEHGRHVLDDALLVLHQPRGDDHRAHRSARHHPSDERPLRVEADGLEDEEREAHQGASPERDERVVDEPLAGESHVVHALFVRAPLAAGVGVAGHQPQRDREMDRGQQPGVTVGSERQEVHHQPRRGERNGEPVPPAPGQSAFQREEDGQERQDEEAEIAHVEHPCPPRAPGSGGRRARGS